MHGFSDSFQEAILRLSGVCSLEQLEEAVQEALECALPNVVDAVVYLEPIDGQGLVSSHGLLHALPREGLTRSAVQERKRIAVQRLSEADPIAGLLRTSPTHNISRKASGLLCCGGGWSNNHRSHVICSPVEDKESDRVVAVFVIVCDDLSKEQHQHLTFLERQLLVCLKRLRQSLYLTTPASATILPTSSSTNSRLQCSDILDLCAELYDQDAASLQVKVVKYLATHTGAQYGFILVVSPDSKELFCQAIGDNILKDELVFQVDKNSFGTVLKTKEPISLEHISTEQRTQLEEILSCRIESLLCVPVISRVNQEVMAIACMVNKNQATQFYENDIEIIKTCFKYTATVLHSTLAVQNERRLKNQTQTMLQVAKNLFTHLDDLTVLLREIMEEAKNLTKAERCSVFLLEEDCDELVAKVFDGDVDEIRQVAVNHEVRIPANQGIAGHVATTGELLNIDDAYDHPLFYRGIDEATGFRTRSILCFPIKDETNKVIGVAQLCNKLNGGVFSSFDEDIAQAFSVYCCISIVHSLLYKRVQDTGGRYQLANELMIYHMRVADEEVHDLAQHKVLPVHDFGAEMNRFSFTPRSVTYDKTVMAVFSMLEDMNFINRFRVPRDSLARFVLMVRRGYRDPPYHNWTHAFSVAHFCYLLYKNTQMAKLIGENELFSLMIACLCHDIDHRGTTNSYQVASDSVLATLYSSEGSVMERHHFAQTMCILNTSGCNIFENISRANYEKVLDLMRDIILATDLAHHLKIFKDVEQMARDGYNKNNKEHRMLLLCIMMTSCDLSDQTKNWRNTKKIANLVYQEFFRQGDLEKTSGQKPLEMMDRERAYIPELQLGFLDGIAIPLFRLLNKLLPEAVDTVEAVESNRRMWVKMNDKMLHLQKNSMSSMDVFEVEIEEDLTQNKTQFTPADDTNTQLPPGGGDVKQS